MVVQGERIVMVGSLADARQSYPDAPVQDVGFAISPPPVNAHTHLDLSQLPYFQGSYEDFIRHVILQADQVRGVKAAREGLADLRDYGTDAFGDIVANADVMRFLLQQPELKGVAYWEVINPNPDEAEKEFAETVELLREFRRLERPDGLKLGLSPHTPHTVSGTATAKTCAAERCRKPTVTNSRCRKPCRNSHATRWSWPTFRADETLFGDVATERSDAGTVSG